LELREHPAQMVALVLLGRPDHEVLWDHQGLLVPRGDLDSRASEETKETLGQRVRRDPRDRMGALEHLDQSVQWDLWVFQAQQGQQALVDKQEGQDSLVSQVLLDPQVPLVPSDQWVTLVVRATEDRMEVPA